MLTTERLLLRAFSPEDTSALQAIFADFNASVYKYLDTPHPEEEEAVHRLTLLYRAQPLFFAVESKETKALMGFVCFHEHDHLYDLGYNFHSAYHGKGYASESIRAAMEYISSVDPQARFTAGTGLANTPSCNLLRRLGFRLIGTELLSFHRDEEGRPITFQGGIFCLDSFPEHSP